MGMQKLPRTDHDKPLIFALNFLTRMEGWYFTVKNITGRCPDRTYARFAKYLLKVLGLPRGCPRPGKVAG